MSEHLKPDTHPVLLGREVSSHGRFAFIHEILAHPDLIHKNPEWLEKQYNVLVKVFDKPRAQEIYEYSSVQKSLEMDTQFLESTIPEFLPKYAIVEAGQNAVNSKTYMLMEKIYPNALSKENIQSFYRQLDTLLSKSLGAFITPGFDKEWQRGFLPDFKPDNVSFGKAASDTDDKLYLIDLFPVLKRTTRQAIADVSDMITPYKTNYSFPLTQEKILILNNLP